MCEIYWNIKKRAGEKIGKQSMIILITNKQQILGLKITEEKAKERPALQIPTISGLTSCKRIVLVSKKEKMGN